MSGEVSIEQGKSLCLDAELLFLPFSSPAKERQRGWVFLRPLASLSFLEMLYCELCFQGNKAVAFGNNTPEVNSWEWLFLLIAPIEQLPYEPNDKSQSKVHSGDEVRYKKTWKVEGEDSRGSVDLVLIAAKQSGLTKSINAPFSLLDRRSTAKQERKGLGWVICWL